MDLYLIRHTRAHVETGICYGQLDVPLLPSYEEEFAEVVGKLPIVEIVYTSPLVRCRLLAQRLAELHRARLAIDSRWSELDFGEWEGRAWSEIDRKESDYWATHYFTQAPPKGESYRHLYERVSESLRALVAQSQKRAAVVSHAGPIRAVLAQCMGMAAEKYPTLTLGEGAVSLLNWNGEKWHLKYMNR